ncbi:MAG: hypothetical protein AB8E82_06680 [Aureispira sp.]
MRLYLVLLPFLLFGQSNLWSWQIINPTNKTTTTSMTRQEIEEQLSLTKDELEAFLKKNNLTAAAVFNTEQLAAIEQAYQILGITAAPQDIGKKTFIDYVQDWVQDFISILDEERRTDIKISVEDIITSLREKIKKPDFPISKVLWKNIKTEIQKLESPTTAEGLRGALLNGFNAFNSDMASKFMLTKHYQKNKATYQKIKTKELNQQTMIANDFETWLTGILGVASKKQRELEKEQRELEKEQRELEKEQRELEKEQLEKEDAFKLAYAQWLGEQRTKISGIISADKGTDSINTMSKAKFMALLVDQSQVWGKLQPELGMEIRAKILRGIQGDSLEIKDYVNALNTAFTNIETPKDIIAKHWHDKKEFVDITGLITGLTANNDGTSKYDILEEYIQWFGQVGNAVESMKLSPNRQFIATKLVEGFGTLLTTPEFRFFVPKLEENIKAYGKGFLSLAETSQLWKNSVVHFIKNPDALLTIPSINKMPSESMDKLDSLLIGQVGVDSLHKMLQKALRPLPKPDALAKGEAMELVLKLSDGTMLVSKILTTIAKENKVPHAIPSSVELNVSKGSSAYDFEAKPLLNQSAVVRSDNQVTVDFEYTIAFSKDRGTSQLGGSSDIERAKAISVEESTEHSRTEGKEKTKTEGSSYGLEGSGSFDIGLFSLELGGHRDWTEETSETTIKSKTQTNGTTVGVSEQVETMEGKNWSATVNHGNDTGFIKIKCYLTSAEIGTETMVLSIEGLEITSPDLKEFGMLQPIPTTNKTVRWKK